MSAGRWFRVYESLLENPGVQRLPPTAFKRAFFAALRGEKNEFDGLVRPDSGRPSASEWAALRAEAFARDDYTCRYCGERGGRLECDHIMPVSRGGTSEPENLATSCRDCNRAKRNKLPAEWLQ